MSRTGRIWPRVMAANVAFVVCLAATGATAGQGSAPGPARTPEVATGFTEFSARMQAYVKIQQAAASSIPALKPTDLPEVISAFQLALARKIREARPAAREGDIFTSAACDAFRRASLTAFEGPNSASSRAYMGPGAPDPNMPLPINGVYPGTAPVTPLAPALLAAFPPLPAELAYRIVGRTLVLIDVKSSVVVDVARLILPPMSGAGK